MLIILFSSFLILLLINMPIAFALGIATLITLASSDTLPLNSIVTRAFVGVDSFTLLAIPFFIAAGEIMNACGITERIVNLSRAIVGHIREVSPTLRSCPTCSFREFPVQQPRMHPPSVP